MRASSRPWMVLACVIAALPAALSGQPRELPEIPGSIIARHAVVGAPLAADVVVTLPRVVGGTRTTYTGNARYLRDSHGRVRVDQFVVPPAGGQSGSEARSILQPDGTRPTTLLVDHAKQLVTTISPGMALMLVGGGNSFVVATGQRDSLNAHGADHIRAFHRLSGEATREELLGSRRMAGVDTIGRRLTVVLPPGIERNDAPIELVEERWDAADLRLTIYARLSDPRVGVAEYRVTSLKRVESSTGEFDVPAGYSTGTINPTYTAGWESWLNPPGRRPR